MGPNSNSQISQLLEKQKLQENCKNEKRPATERKAVRAAEPPSSAARAAKVPDTGKSPKATAKEPKKRMLRRNSC